MVKCYDKAPISGDTVKACDFGRTHQGICHTREGVQTAYYPATTPTLPGRGMKVPCCPEYIGGTPYCQPPNMGLSCKWVTGPGGLGYERCDNYQSYHDVAVNGELMNDPGYPQIALDLDPYLDSAQPITGTTYLKAQADKKNDKKEWYVGIGILSIILVSVVGFVYSTGFVSPRVV